MRMKRIKKAGAVFLSFAMILGMMPAVTRPMEVHAESTAPDTAYWTDVDGLKSYNMTTSDPKGKIRFGKNGEGVREWYICGPETVETEEPTDTVDTLALLSTSQFGDTVAYGSDSKYSTSNFVTDINKYSDDDSGTNSTYLGDTYFFTSELTKMQPVTVSTNEPDGSGGNTATQVTNKKLYLPNSLNQNSNGTTSIFVGADNNIPINLEGLNGTTDYVLFWLRSPSDANSRGALVAYPGLGVRDNDVNYDDVSVVPAFNLNLSSVLFASAANAASSSYNGDQANITMTANTYTLRYAPTDTGWDTISAEINADGTSVKAMNADGKYLMVQNSDGVYASAISGADTTINASNITINETALTNFNNCKVWVESTDTTNRITTAKLATQATEISSVAITVDTPAAGNALDTVAAFETTGVKTTEPTVSWTPTVETAENNRIYTASVTLEATDGYAFTDGTTATVNGKAATVKKNPEGTLTVSYAFPKTAARKLTDNYYATKDDLMDCFELESSDKDKVGKVIFGQNGKTGEETAPQEWMIAGTDTRVSGDNMVLFAATPLLTNKVFNSVYNPSTKAYDSEKGCNYGAANAPTNVNVNHYGMSDLRQTIQWLEENTSYFSSTEQGLMNDTTITTNDTLNGVTYTTTDKLYAAYGDYNDDQYITVGTNTATQLNSGLKIDINNWGSSLFWLRSPINTSDINALVAFPVFCVINNFVTNDDVSVVPAFNLNLSSVLFASAANAASSTGEITGTMTPNTYTLRYAPTDTGWNDISAEINADGTSVKAMNADGKYLMVQNSEGVYASAISGADTTINASNITINETALTNFNNCKVWVESTDTTNRITTAKLATQATEISSVAITVDTPAAGNALDTVAAFETTGVKTTEPTVSWTPTVETAENNRIYTASVTLEATDGYAFTDGTTATVNGKSATVKQNANGTLTVTYAFPKTTAKKLTDDYYATRDDLMDCFGLESSDKDKVGKVIFGQNGKTGEETAPQEWMIAGTDTRVSGDNMVLFAATPLLTNKVFNSEYNPSTKAYDSEKGCNYGAANAPTNVNVNHYGMSDLRQTIQWLEENTSYFSSTEQGLMNDTTITTNDTLNGVTYTTTDKLYAAYGDYNDDQYITVGTNTATQLNSGLKIDINNWGSSLFWLRSPNNTIYYSALVAYPGYSVFSFFVNYINVSVVPAFNLNLSSVLFASAAEAASSTGEITGTMTPNTYTLRYAPTDTAWDTISAEINADGTSVKAMNADQKYLMVQNSDGVYASEISGADTTINASSITINETALTDFNNCKVWVESTTDNITTAKLAVTQIETIAITGIDTPAAESALDTTAACETTVVKTTEPTISWTPDVETAENNRIYTASVTLEATDGYAFTDGTTATVNGKAATVKKNPEGTLTVSYAFPKTAARELTDNYYATKDDLMDCFELESSDKDKVGKVIFGQNVKTGEETAPQEWMIAGTDTGVSGDNIVLFAATPLGAKQAFNSSTNKKDYVSAWKCVYQTAPNTVYANHYGGSDLRQTLLGLETNKKYFSTVEQGLMNDTTITTNDTSNGVTYTTTDKLYAAYGDYNDDQYITVGTNTATQLNSGLKIDIKNWGSSLFWLRSPSSTSISYALVASPGDDVDYNFVYLDYVSVVPAFNLNLSSVLFASAANAASSTYNGAKANSTMTENTYTLRYSGNALDSANAEISENKKTIKITGATDGMYLMIQNSDGAYAVDVSSNTLVAASDITIDESKLSTFNGCKVWLETTDATSRITTAKEAEQGTQNNYIENNISKVNSFISKDYTGSNIELSTTKGTDITWSGGGTATVEGYYTKGEGDTYTETTTAGSGAANEGGAPVKVGTYYAKVSVAESGEYVSTTAMIKFTVEKPLPTAASFTYADPTDLDYNGTSKEASVDVTNGVTGLGFLTVKYKASGTEEYLSEPPMYEGTYDVYACVEEGDIYAAAEVKVGTFTITYTDGVGEHLYGYSLSLAGDIGINFFMLLDESVTNADNAYVEFTLSDGTKTQMAVKDAPTQQVGVGVDAKDYYKFTCNVNAKQMHDRISAQMVVVNDGQSSAGKTYVYSVSQYIESMLERTDTEAVGAQKLIKAMRAYGIYAEQYFDTNSDYVEEIDSETASEIGQITAANVTADSYSLTGTLPEGISYYGTSLLLESKTVIRHYFTVEDGHSIAEYQFKISDQDQEAVQKGNYYYIDCPASYANELDQSVTVSIQTASASANVASLSYTPLSYVKSMLGKELSDANLKALIQSLYLYHTEAKAYKNR